MVDPTVNEKKVSKKFNFEVQILRNCYRLNENITNNKSLICFTCVSFAVYNNKIGLKYYTQLESVCG